MSKFIVDKSFWEIFPEANVGVLLLDNVDNSGASSENVIKLLKESNEEAKKYLTEAQLSQNPAISVWREAYQKFKTKKGLDETNAMIKFLNGILFYENDSTKMIEILSETLKKLSVKRQVLVIKYLLANHKSKVGEVEEARKLYEEVIKNGNKLYIVEETKEKLKNLIETN